MRGLTLLIACTLLCGCGESFNTNIEAGPVIFRCAVSGTADGVEYFRVDTTAKTLEYYDTIDAAFKEYQHTDQMVVGDGGIMFEGSIVSAARSGTDVYHFKRNGEFYSFVGTDGPPPFVSSTGKCELSGEPPKDEAIF